MTISPPEIAERNRKGATRLGIGGWLGVLAAIIAIVLPSGALFAATYNPGGFFSFAPRLLQASALLVLVGAVFYFLSLILYRFAFATLQKVEPEFTLASVLCLIGSVGFLLIVVAAAVVLGNASSLLDCLKGQPSHVLSCLQANQPLGAYTVLVGFVCAWLGGFGIVLGLWIAGGHYDEPALDLAAVLYLFFLLLLFAPLVEVAYPFPGGEFLLVAVPILAIAAPALVLVGLLLRERRARSGFGGGSPA